MDEEKIKAQGFSNVKAIDKSLEWKGLTIHRTGGQHGTGEIAKRMGEVSGFVFSNKNKSIYVAGDTVWCEEVERALETYRPHVTIVNAGGAKFLTSDPITMTPHDIEQVYKKLSSTKIIAVHMETINHCLITREKLSQALTEKGISKAVLIPKDGEVITV